MTTKDRKIIDDAERDGIPIFVLVAKDRESLATIAFYHDRCILAGCVPTHIKEVSERIVDFATWTGKNVHLVKLPD